MASSSSDSTTARDSPVDMKKLGGIDCPPPNAQRPDQQARIGITRPSNSDSRDFRNRWQIEPEPQILDAEAKGMTGAMNRVLSGISAQSSWNPEPPPDGGKAAWLACICAHLIIMNTWGFVNSFGVFQTYYQSNMLADRTPSEISWIGSLAVFLTFFVGAFSGRFTDAGFFRPILALGTLLLLLGVFATSVATSYWHLLLAQGLCMGLGSGCLFTPVVSTVSTYFDRRRSLAIGLAASGSVTGGVLFPAMARQLLPHIGFGWTVRAIGFVQLATCLFANAFITSRLPPRRAGSVVEWAAFRELDYTFYALGMFFSFWGVYFGLYYISSFARSDLVMHPEPLSYADSLNLLLLVNGVGLVGRLVPSYYADRVGALNLMIPTCLVTGVALLAWTAVDDGSSLYVWSVFFGIGAGGISSLFPAVLSSLTIDLGKRGTRMGMAFTIVSFAVLTGNPIAGAIITAHGGRYWGAQTFTGCSLLVGMGLIFCARLAKQRRVGSGWVPLNSAHANGPPAAKLGPTVATISTRALETPANSAFAALRSYSASGY
ncbi:hypothetical protein PG989_000146 [Apiospora arundinis]